MWQLLTPVEWAAVAGRQSQLALPQMPDDSHPQWAKSGGLHVVAEVDGPNNPQLMLSCVAKYVNADVFSTMLTDSAAAAAFTFFLV